MFFSSNVSCVGVGPPVLGITHTNLASFNGLFASLTLIILACMAACVIACIMLCLAATSLETKQT